MPAMRPRGVSDPVWARAPSGSGLSAGGVGLPVPGAAGPEEVGSGAGDDGGAVGPPVSVGVGVGVGPLSPSSMSPTLLPPRRGSSQGEAKSHNEAIGVF